MAGLIALINAISADVVARMAAANLPALVDGGISIGLAKSSENSFIPRILFIPTTVSYSAPSPGANSSPINPLNANAPGAGVRSYQAVAMGGGYVQASTTVTVSVPDVAGGTRATATATVSSNGAIIAILPLVAGSGYLNPPTVAISGVGTGATYSASLQPPPQYLVTGTSRAIKTAKQRFEVRVWGASSTAGVVTPDALTDFDATQQLADQIIASCQRLAPGVHEIGNGVWWSSKAEANIYDAVGGYYVFTIDFMTPVLSEPITPTAGPSVVYAPTNTKPGPTFYIQPFGGGTPEQP